MVRETNISGAFKHLLLRALVMEIVYQTMPTETQQLWHQRQAVAERIVGGHAAQDDAEGG